MKAYMFPGQGAQFRGMGSDLFAKYPDLTRTANAILGYSLEVLCRDDAEQKLADTRYTQPALFVVSVLSYLEHLRSDPSPPDFVLGHSLGEYTALFASGVFDFATGLRIIQRRSELMALFASGGMMAVLGQGRSEIAAVLSAEKLDDIDIANYNGPAQHVLAGPQPELERARAALVAEGYRCVSLSVSGPFHSRHMRVARERFAYSLERYLPTFKSPTVPVIANIDARPYAMTDLFERLTGQIDRPVRWDESIRYLTRKGVTHFVELGPGEILSRLVNDIDLDERARLKAPDQQDVAQP